MSLENVCVKMEPKWEDESEAELKDTNGVLEVYHEVKVEVVFENDRLQDEADCVQDPLKQEDLEDIDLKETEVCPKAIPIAITTASSSACPHTDMIIPVPNKDEPECILSDNKPHLCYTCNKIFEHESDLQNHKCLEPGSSHLNKEITEKKPQSDSQKIFSCNTCKKGFAHKKVLIRHIKTHTDEKPYMCEICDKPCKTFTGLKQHAASHKTDKKEYSCDVCNKKFRFQCFLKRHALLHTGEKPHQCEVCKRQFAQQSHLLKHMRIHTGEKPFTCETCNKNFRCKSNLVQHQLMHTRDPPPTCHICNKQYQQKIHLEKHIMRIHQGIKPYMCEICNKPFRDKCDLKRHMLFHTGEKPFSCEICQKQFAQNCMLTQHMQIHTGEKPYTCEICNKQFRRRSHLDLHKRIHTGEKPHVCGICNKQFTEGRNLAMHMRIHTGEKPHDVYFLESQGKIREAQCKVVRENQGNLLEIQKVSQWDGCPRHICVWCRAQMLKYSVLRRQCQRSQGILQKALAESRVVTVDYLRTIDRVAQKLSLNLKTCSVYTSDSTQPEFIKIEDTIKEETNDFIENIFINEPDFDDSDVINNEINETNGSINTYTLEEVVVDLKRTRLAKTSKKRKKCDKQIDKSKNPKIVEANTKTKRIIKRRMADNGFLPDFNFDEFQTKYNVRIDILSKEEQLREVEGRKMAASYTLAAFGCEVCGKGFATKAVYDGHMAKHSVSAGAHACEICLVRFKTRSRAHVHQDTHRLKFTCEACGFVTRTRFIAKNHFLSHAGTTHKCPHCDAVFSKYTSYLTHVRRRHPAANTACEMCGETFVGDNGLRHHKTRTHRNSEYLGDRALHGLKLDNKQFPRDKTKLDRFFIPENTYIANFIEIVGAVSEIPKPYKNTRIARLKLSVPQFECKCVVCGAHFTSVAAMETHAAAATDGCDDSMRPCPHCGEECRSDEGLGRHQREHHAQRALLCRECNKWFSDAQSWGTHRARAHLNQRLKEPPRARPRPAHAFVCETCGSECTVSGYNKRGIVNGIRISNIVGFNIIITKVGDIIIITDTGIDSDVVVVIFVSIYIINILIIVVAITIHIITIIITIGI
ncbi:hypothetical protein MSG28_016112 [Choristoneura fumiferana]|uniref:Uncharacterized protein n=1 Tax=Choristoneura fumiferana TaxID=7141 RepID=A0ACC0K5X6_CHOFU|nr:hypothetical protein MSG28_016112 [Choristoneura fumiferana]